MAPLPKRRHSTQRSGKRQSANQFSPPQITTCKNCQEVVRPHTVCRFCGYYKGKQVLKIKDKKVKAN